MNKVFLLVFLIWTIGFLIWIAGTFIEEFEGFRNFGLIIELVGIVGMIILWRKNDD